MNVFAVSTVCLALVYCVYAQSSQEPCTGVMIGSLPTLFQNVSGTLYVEDEFSFCIDSFAYDGGGPDTFLYFYYPGAELSEVGGGVLLPITTQESGRAQFDFNRGYFGNLNYRFRIPENKFRTCDFRGFGLWCRFFNLLFTSITWQYDDIFSTNATEGRIQCTLSPGRGYVGLLPTLGSGVSGQLYVRDTTTFVIRNFTYDGQGTETFVYVFVGGGDSDDGDSDGDGDNNGDGDGAPSGQGMIIPLTTNNVMEGSFDDTAYTGLPEADFVITIPGESNFYTCDVTTFTIWSRNTSAFFTMIEVNTDEIFTNNQNVRDYEPNLILCDRPSTQPGILIGELPTSNSKAISGTVYVRDENTIFIQLFSYDGEQGNVFIYSFPPGVQVRADGVGGKTIAVSEMMESLNMTSTYFNQEFTIYLRLASGGAIKACDVGTLALIARDGSRILTMIVIPENIFSEDDTDPTKIMCISGALPITSTLTLFGACVIAVFAMLSCQMY